MIASGGVVLEVSQHRNTWGHFFIAMYIVQFRDVKRTAPHGTELNTNARFRNYLQHTPQPSTPP